MKAEDVTKIKTGQEVVPYKVRLSRAVVGVGVPDNPQNYDYVQIEHMP